MSDEKFKGVCQLCGDWISRHQTIAVCEKCRKKYQDRFALECAISELTKTKNPDDDKDAEK